MTHLRSTSVAPHQRRAASRPRALPTLAPALAAAALAACGGGEGGVGPGSSQARLNVTVQAALASGASNLQLVVVPTYARSGGAVATLSPVTVAYTAGATQSLPVDVDLTPCLNDAARTPATQGTCAAGAAVSLVSGGTVLDSVSVGPFNLTGGSTTPVTVSFAQVGSIQLSRQGGGAVGGTQSVTVPQGGTLALVATVLGTTGSPLSRGVTWSSSQTGVATVNANGVVTAAGVGTTVITARAGGVSATVQVVVPTTLTVTTAGAGAGTVTSSPAGITCTSGAAAGCTASFDPQQGVTLTAAPDANSTFTGFTGATCSGTAATCIVPMNANQAVTATFARRRVALTVNVGAGGSVQVTGGNVAPATVCAAGATCVYQVDAGVTVNTVATPATGNQTTGWTGACAGTPLTVNAASATCGRTYTADATVGVTFGPRGIADTVSVSATGTAPSGVTLGGDVFPSGFINGQPTTNLFSFPIAVGTPLNGFAFDAGSLVTLRFTPNGQTRLVSWGGQCASVGVVSADPAGVSTCTFTSAGRSQQVTLNLAPR